MRPIIAPSAPDDTARIGRRAPDPDAREVLRRWRRKLGIVNRSAEKLRVVEDVFRLHPDEPVIVFTASNRMALDVSARFLIPALTAHSDKHERNRVLDAFADGRVNLVVAVPTPLAVRAGRLPAAVIPFKRRLPLRDLLPRLEAFRRPGASGDDASPPPRPSRRPRPRSA